MSGAELAALTAAMAPEAAAGTAAAGTAGTGLTAGMLGPAAGLGTTEGLLAAGAPTSAELLGSTAFGGDAALLGLKGLDTAHSGMGGGTSSLFGGGEGLEFLDWANIGKNTSVPWQSMAKQGLDMMDQSQKPIAGLGQRPAGYNPQKSMQEQFAEIMGWLQKNGGM